MAAVPGARGGPRAGGPHGRGGARADACVRVGGARTRGHRRPGLARTHAQEKASGVPDFQLQSNFRAALVAKERELKALVLVGRDGDRGPAA